MTGIFFHSAGDRLAAQSAAPAPETSFESHLALAGVNAALAGVTGGLYGLAGGRGFGRPFIEALPGGALAYSGRIIAARGFWGAGIIGRQVSALGISVVRNAGRGTDDADEFVFPAGPVRLYVRKETGNWSLQPRIDVIATGFLATALLRHDMQVLWGESLSAGAPVIAYEALLREDRVTGKTFGSAILVRPEAGPATVGHERVHVLQRDFAFHLWGDPFQEWIARGDAGLTALAGSIDIDIAYPAFEALIYSALGTPYLGELREREARLLSPASPQRSGSPGG